MNGQDRKTFYKPDKIDYILGSIGFAVILVGAIGSALFENNFMPYIVLLLIYVSGIVFHGSRIGYRRAPTYTIRRGVGRLGWLLTLGF
jgi:hypothetical protein